MSKDIRSFFSTVGGSKKKEDTPKLHIGAKSEKKSSGTKKRLIVLSDSDDDDIIPSSSKKRSKEQSDEKTTKTVVKKPAPVITPKKQLKLVNPMDVFGSEKVKRSSEVTAVNTPKEEPAEVPKKKKKKGATDDAPGWDESFSDMDFLSTLDQLDAIEAQATKGKTNKSTENISTKSTPIKMHEENGKTSMTLTIKGKALDDLQKFCAKSERKSSNKDKAEKLLDDVKVEVPDKIKSKKDKKEKESNEALTDSKNKTSSIEECLTNSRVDESLVEEEEDDGPSWANDPAEKRRLSAIGYQRYLAREGPKNAGSKEIPKGKPDCLKGLVFVISGVLDSLERDAAAELIQECGGKVTSSVSRNTSYIVLGDDAGPSKVHKAKQCGTKQLDEDGLLDLIRSKSGIPAAANAKSPPKGKETTSAYFDNKPETIVTDKDSKKKDESGKKKSSSGVDAKSFYGKAACKDKKVSSNTNLVERESKREEPAAVEPSSSGVEPRKPASQGRAEGCGPRDAQSAPPAKPAESLMWVDKYKPTSTKQIIGQQSENSNVKKLVKWLQNWDQNQRGRGGKKIERPSPWARNDDGAYFKAALLSGPPGVGKTTTAHLVCKELGYDVVEMNASDTRGQKRLHSEVAELLSSKSLYSYFQGGGQATSAKHVLLMDEVDGMAGNEDRGGISELMQLIRTSKVPIICMCNDRNHQKLRTFVTHCFDLKFAKPRVEQIQGAMMSVCCREGVKMSRDTMRDLIVGSSQDVRQVLHHLSMYAAKPTADEPQGSQKEEVKQIKNIRLGPWDVLAKVFSAEDHKTMSMNDKSSLFFFDYNLGPLFVQENYLNAVPAAAGNDKFKRMDLIAEAADSLCWGDVVEKTIRSRTDAWSLLPTQAVFSSVVPGDLLSGTIQGQIRFPSWLGKNSTGGKRARLLSEVHAHTRLATSGSRQAVNFDYLRPLRDAVARPLARRGADGVDEAVAVMKAYHLVRADLDSLCELGAWPGQRDPMAGISTQVKSAFTRTLNKECALLPYSQAIGTVSKLKASASVSMYGENNDDEEDGEEGKEADDDDIAADAMIKAKKRAPAKKQTPAKKPADGAAAKKGRGKEPAAGGSKGKGGKGKGKSK